MNCNFIQWLNIYLIGADDRLSNQSDSLHNNLIIQIGSSEIHPELTSLGTGYES